MAILYPTINENNSQRDFQEEFLGYNHNIRISDGEFYDMQNMTGDYYPVLSTRKKRSVIKELAKPLGMVCKDALCYIDNGNLYINGNEIEEFFGTTTSDTRYQKKLVGMGAYLLVFNIKQTGLQDGWYINTEDTTEYGFIDQINSIDCAKNPVQYVMCTADGNEYQTDNKNAENYLYVSDTAPTGKIKNSYKWLDTSGDVHYLKVWSEMNSMWTSLSTTYIKLSAPGIGTGLSEGDGVSISGCEVRNAEDNVKSQIDILNNTIIIKSIEKTENEAAHRG